MDINSKILVLGSRGMVGSAISRHLKANGYTHVVEQTREVVDLLNRHETHAYFNNIKPEYVFIAAAKVGGILANASQQVEFGRDNILIQTNVLDACHVGATCGYIKKVLFLGSSCIYPRNCPQPIKEEYLLTGELEPTNHMYALSKIHGIKMCQAYKNQYGYNFISCMPTNLYGENDNFDVMSSHVFPAIIRKIHEAKVSGNIPKFWGDGSSLREFLCVDDMATASIFLMNQYEGNDPINVGCGYDISIKDLVNKVCNIIGYSGKIEWDTTKPNGTPKKLLDVSKINALGWRSSIDLDEGIRNTYNWYIRSKNVS
jgi:GDP-L-fucose synthase